MSRKYIDYYDENLARYFKDVKNSEGLTSEKEVELAKRIQAGDQRAKDELVNANLKFVVSVAKDYQNQGLSLSDLISEGNEGLIKAAEKFDHTKGFKFISYAVWWIKQSIKQSLNENSRIIRLPVNVISQSHTDKKTKEKFEAEFGRELEFGDTYINEEGVETDFVGDHLPSTISLNNKINEDSDELSEIISDDANIEENMDLSYVNNVKTELNRLLEVLDERERDVVTLYFGLNPHYGVMNLEDIGEKFSITKERVRQIKSRAIKKLKSKSTELFNYLNQ